MTNLTAALWLVLTFAALASIVVFVVSSARRHVVMDPDEQLHIVQDFLSHAEEQAVINKFTNWQRNQWARAGYPRQKDMLERFRGAGG